ncbi:putative protease Do-like 14 isoform X2 [Brachypodium distachyon]|uniref:putative protease Do-like 14 isoform X2 n=1 Tax=Brachypodium distachyon TaxID=15368 RepID=UPI000D0D617C|nr:putative protease Do-like 14 isoform X2 [Brachypodium distachyon]|eukprot:XP_024311137.1 putative protease Do-like 14 isoform X2 [Brachypodium distachyon]
MEDRSNPRKRRTMESIRREHEDEHKERNLAMANSDEDEEVVGSSPPSSPLHKMPLRDPASFATFDQYVEWVRMLKEEMSERSRVRPQLPTVYFTPQTKFNTPQLFPLRESGTKAVRSASKFVVGLSSSLEGEPLKRCSGFWIDWDEESGIGTLLTTAHLIRTKEPDNSVWLGGQEYAPHANVIVHLLDGKTADGQLLYHQPHYDLAFFEVAVHQRVPVPCFNEEVKFAQDVLQLGRDKSLDLRITHGRAAYSNPSQDERYHYMYLHSEDDEQIGNEYDNGGPVIDLDGKVVGLFNTSSRGSFIPSYILLKCCNSWKKYGAIFRPHLGLTFEAIKLLEPGQVDKIWRMYDIEDGLIVQEVCQKDLAPRNLGSDKVI